MDALQMSLSATALIIAVVIIRTLALHKLPKQIFLILWDVVICRLLIPFSIPSRFSLYTGINLLKKAFTENAAATTLISMTGNMDSATGAEHTTSTVFDSPIIAIWLIGVCACVLFFIMTYFKCRREFQTSLPVTNDFTALWLKENPLRRHVQIRQCDKINTPLTYGVFRPVVLLPKTTDWTDEIKLRYILTHEFVHIRRFDTLTKILLALVLCVHWFNPFVWVMYVLVNRDIELSCDETVVKAFGDTKKSAYAMMLIGMEEKKTRLTPLVNNFSKNAIEERIVSIMKMKKISLAGIILALVLVMGTTTVFATNATADSNQNKNIQTTTDTASTAAMSYTDESGVTRVSTDDGKTWMSEEEYLKAYPTSEVVWWTYDEYKAWLEQEKVDLQNVIGGKAWNETDGWYVWTQEKVDETLAMYEEILEEIKNGIKVSKTVDGSDDVIMSYNPGEIATTSGYGITVVDDKGNTKDFGPYDSKEDLLAVLKPYCDKQVKLGKMTQQEADEILSKYK